MPFFGICLGMQMACIEGARNTAGITDATSSEFGPGGSPIVGIITEWMSEEGLQKREAGGDLGGTMRLGAYDATLSGNSHVASIYNTTSISERHRHQMCIRDRDCHWNASGAHTGCLSVAMLAEAGAKLVIVGHSERRTDNHETDAEVKAKASAAIAGGLVAIVCVGETEAQRDAGHAIGVVTAQLQGSVPEVGRGETLVIAYEPVWAIGTGRTPTVADVADMHAAIRQCLRQLLGNEGAKVRILYGGSVKPSNAAELLHIPDVDGALVGGASLKAADFVPIIDAAK